MTFSKNFARNYEKKNNTWNTRHLVNELFVPATQRPSVLYWRLLDFKTVEAANKFSRSHSEEEFIIKDFSMKMAIKFQVSSILCYKVVHL
jgi:hypothetical protein